MSNRPHRTQPLQSTRARSIEAIAAALATTALHLVVASYLLLYTGTDAVSETPVEIRTVLTLIDRESLEKPPAPSVPHIPKNPVISLSTRSDTNDPKPAITSQAPSPDSAGVGNDTLGPLVLTIPNITSSGTFNSDVMDRSKGPPRYDQTRFSGAWAPDGGPVQKTWAQRSQATHLLLSATGALDFPCTREEKRLRKPRCSGAQYGHDEIPNVD